MDAPLNLLIPHIGIKTKVKLNLAEEFRSLMEFQDHYFDFILQEIFIK